MITLYFYNMLVVRILKLEIQHKKIVKIMLKNIQVCFLVKLYLKLKIK